MFKAIKIALLGVLFAFTSLISGTCHSLPRTSVPAKIDKLDKNSLLIVKKAEKAGLSESRLDEIIGFLVKTGEVGAQFIENHWQAILGGAGIFALWGQEKYRKSQGEKGLIETITTRFKNLARWLFWLAVIVVGFMVLSSILKLLS